MKATKTVTWETKDGRNIEVEITKTRGVQEKTANLDGDIVTLGKETVDTLEITLSVNGEFKTRDFDGPNVATRKFYKNYEKIKAAGAYARLGDVFISEEQYTMVTEAIGELEAEVNTTEEYAEVKAREEAKEAAKVEADKKESEHYAQLRKSGLCPKCGTWCYGDCEAS